MAALSTPLMPAPIEPSMPNMDGFESFAANESSASRRQRISMACQYCRHRKIRCCGGTPCRNCTRSSRECDYSAVPEEVNRATREKKAAAKATKSILAASQAANYAMGLSVSPYPASVHSFTHTPMTSYSPYFMETPTFDVGPGSGYVASPLAPSPMGPAVGQFPFPPTVPSFNPSAPAPAAPYGSDGTIPPKAIQYGHRRSSSTPNITVPSWNHVPPTPQLGSPAMIDSATHHRNVPAPAPTYPAVSGWSSAPITPAVEVPAPVPTVTSARVFPSVLEQTPLHTAYLAATSGSAPTSAVPMTTTYTAPPSYGPAATIAPLATSSYTPHHTYGATHSHGPHQGLAYPLSTPLPYSTTVPLTPPESRGGSIEADAYLSVAASSTAPGTAPLAGSTTVPASYAPVPVPSTPSYLAPPQRTPLGFNFKNLSIQTGPALGMGMTAPISPPISPSSGYYTPTYPTSTATHANASGNGMYYPGAGSAIPQPVFPTTASTEGTTSSLYTPSPPAISPTLAPEMTASFSLAQKDMSGVVGLGLAMNGGASQVPVVEHDVFYTPHFPTEEYFTLQ